MQLAISEGCFFCRIFQVESVQHFCMKFRSPHASKCTNSSELQSGAPRSSQAIKLWGL